MPSASTRKRTAGSGGMSLCGQSAALAAAIGNNRQRPARAARKWDKAGLLEPNFYGKWAKRGKRWKVANCRFTLLGGKKAWNPRGPKREKGPIRPGGVERGFERLRV